MAILNKIRQQSLVLILVIALALFAFILSGLFDGSTNFSGKSQNIVATVNGTDIGREEFMSKVENAQRRFRGGSTSQAMNFVWDQELRRVILQEQYDALGISVERDQMRNLLEQNLGTFPEFQNEAGLFDEGKLNEFIANLKEISPEQGFLNGSPINYQTWVELYESQIAARGIEESYFNMVRAGLTGTLTEGKLDHKLTNDNVDVKFVQIPYTLIPDSTITVTRSDITKYINDNPSKYEIENSRDLSYVVFRETASLEDENAIKQSLITSLNDTDGRVGFKNTEDNAGFLISEESAIQYNDNFQYKNQLGIASDSLYGLKKGDTYGPYRESNMFKIAKIVETRQLPDSVKVRHILIPFVPGNGQDPTTVKTEEQAKTTADSILAILKRNRSKFDDLLELSSDLIPGKDTNGEVELAYNSGIVGPEMNKFSFENKKGDLEVIKTTYGFHVTEILEQKNQQKVLKVATLAKRIDPSEETIDEVFKATSKFEIAVANTDFNAEAEANKYIVRPVNGIKELDENIPGIGVQRAMVRWSFEKETEVGDIKRFNIPGGGYAIAILNAKKPKGLMSVENASITAIPEVTKQKKAEIIKNRIVAGTMEQIAAAEGQTVKTALALNMKNTTLTGAGFEPKVIGTAFGLEEGETSQLIDGNSGVFIVQVTKITPAADLPNYQAAANRIGVAKSNQSVTALYEALKKAADIEDNRATFY